MGRLPQERLKPAPAWNCTAVDLYGPFRIRGEVQKRTSSTEKFLMVLRRFVSLRGYPAKMISDNVTQLTAANEELKNVVASWDWDELAAFGATKGMEWKFVRPTRLGRTGPQRLL